MDLRSDFSNAGYQTAAERSGYMLNAASAPVTTFTMGDLATAQPANISSQNVSETVPIDTHLIAPGWIPTTVYVPDDPPIFHTETEQLDLLRLVLLVVGVFIGAKILR